MKKKRFSVEQITAVLQQAEGGVPVGDVCRQVGISEQTFYRWKKVYGGMLPERGARAEAAARRKHQAETPRRRPVARQGHAPGRRSKKVLKPVKQREVVHYLMGRYEVSERRAARGRALLSVQRSLSEPPRSADGAAAADARAGADARAVRLSPAAGAAAARRLGARQGALLSRLHRGRTGAATTAPSSSARRWISGRTPTA